MTDDDQTLLARLREGAREQAREALAALYERHAGVVLRFLRRLLDDPNDAEDLLQDTFLAVARHGASVQGPLRPWLFAIAGNRVRDAGRRRTRRTQRERAVSRPEQVAEPETADDQLEAAIRGLTPRMRAVIELRFVNELEHAQVASALGVSLRSLRVPEAPDPETLLARALPEPSPSGSEAWTEGLMQRSTVFADRLMDRLGRKAS